VQVSRLAVKWAKYTAVTNITVRNNLAYVYDFLIRTFFLLVILYIFIQLWSVTYQAVGEERVAGYSFEEIIWYLIFGEAMVMAVPRLTQKIEEEVKKGDIGYQLTRPVHYVLMHYASYMGEAAVRLPVNLLVGGLLGVTLFGWPAFGFGWLGFLVVVVGSFTLNFVTTMTLALCAFWVEETRGLEFVYNKFVFTLGGMMIPIEMFTPALQEVARWLPFQAVTYFAAKTAVQFDLGTMGRMLLVQAGWIAVFAVILGWVYRKGVRKLNVNGG
jgi:ABC-2 type transport system permease protein